MCDERPHEISPLAVIDQVERDCEVEAFAQIVDMIEDERLPHEEAASWI